MMTDDDKEPVKITVVLSVNEREARALERIAKRHKTTLDCAATVAVLIGLDTAAPPDPETQKARILGLEKRDFYTVCIADPDLAKRFEKAGVTRELFEAQQRGEFVSQWMDVWEPHEREYDIIRAHAARIDKLPPTRIHPRSLAVIDVNGEHFVTVCQLLTDEQHDRLGRYWIERFRESPEELTRFCETIARVTRELTGEGSGDAGTPSDGGAGARRRAS